MIVKSVALIHIHTQVVATCAFSLRQDIAHRVTYEHLLSILPFQAKLRETQPGGDGQQTR